MGEQLDTRASIIRSALGEFAQFGFAGARTARIATKAGVNKQLIYYYFGSKSLLYDHVVSMVLNAMTEQQRARVTSRHPPERLRQRLRAAFDHLGSHPHHAQLLLAAVATGGGGGSPAGRVADELAASLARDISEGQGLGHFRDDVSPEAAARHAVALVLGYFITLDPRTRGQDQRDDWVHSVGDLLVRALSW